MENKDNSITSGQSENQINDYFIDTPDCIDNNYNELSDTPEEAKNNIDLDIHSLIPEETQKDESDIFQKPDILNKTEIPLNNNIEKSNSPENNNAENNKTLKPNKKIKINIPKVIASCVFLFCLFWLIQYGAHELKEIELSEDLASRHDFLQAEAQFDKEPEKNNIETNDNINTSNIDETKQFDIEELENELTQGQTKTTILDDNNKGKDPLIILPEMKPFLQENSDTAGWITVGGTKIDNIVVQGTDNDFYLHNNFKKEKSSAGTIFADYRCVVNDYIENQSDNIILYGHKQKSGTMFGTLDKYKNNLEFYKQHPTFTFSNLYGEQVYKIVAMFVCETEPNLLIKENDIFDYQNYINLPTSGGEYSFGKFVTTIKQRSMINTPVTINSRDKFLTLSTCSYEFNNARFIVIGRLVREGEDLEVDVSKATLKKN